MHIQGERPRCQSSLLTLQIPSERQFSVNSED